MADKEEPVEESEEQAKKKPRKKGIVLGGGIVGLIGVAYMMFLMAVPGAVGEKPFGKPQVLDLTAEKIQVNLIGPGKNYLSMGLRCEYRAYDDGAVTSHALEPNYLAYQQDTILRVARQKTKEELDDKVGLEAFSEELRVALNPLLFPIQTGDAGDHFTADSMSGLRAGESIAESTMRDGIQRHVLHMDAPQKTLTLDDGPAVVFEGTEDDLLLEDSKGRTLFVNVTDVIPSFVGDVRVGTQGTIRRILLVDFVVQ